MSINHVLQQESERNDYYAEISLIDIVTFLQGAWKKLFIAAILGAVLGLVGWFVLGSYSAEYVLLNNSNNNSYTLDLVSWKMLQKSLPNLADQIMDENKAPQNQERLYKMLAEDQWWQKNAVPSYAFSKADAKDLAAIGKDLDGAASTILSITLMANGSSKEQSIDNVRSASKFLRTGGAYLQLRSLLNGYESQTISLAADAQQKITDTQVEMGYQQERVKQLEELHKRFPSGSNASGQIIDPRDSGAKYLPLTTQIIAANSDINASKETLERLHKRLDQLALVKTFLEQAIPMQDQTFDGLLLDKELLKIEGELRAKLAKDDSNGQAFLDDLHAQLLGIQVRYTKGLEANTAPTSSGKKGMIKSIAGGLFAAFFLMLLALLAQKVWINVKSGDAE